MNLVILHHDRTDLEQASRYFIHALVPFWRKEGIEVVHVAGTGSMPRADAVLVHVDLSRVPLRFQKAAQTCPVSLNDCLLDIRKSVLPFRNHLVRSAQAYDGPVVVKTDFNYGGYPEWALRRRGTAGLPLLERWALFRDGHQRQKNPYLIYPSTGDVPAGIWKDKRFAVEQFLPEKEGDHYVLRWVFFLGKACVGLKGFSLDPIVRVNGQSKPSQPMPDIHPDVLRYRKAIGLDYGKIDYVIRDGVPVILDVNKTIGGTTEENQPHIRLLAATLAAGLPRCS